MNHAARIVLAGALCLAGCSLPERHSDLKSDVPEERIEGLARAAKAGDRSKARDLVLMLESSDPGVRMLAFGTLREWSGGKTFGYECGAPEPQRREAVKKWAEWADAESSSSGVRESDGTAPRGG